MKRLIVDISELNDHSNDKVSITVQESICPLCNRTDSVLSFGLYGGSGKDYSKVFNWCTAGHKWIEDPDQDDPIIRREDQ